MVSRRTVLVGSVACGTLATSGCLDALPFGDPPVEDVELQIVDVRSPSLGLSTVTIPIMIRVQNTHESDEIPSPIIDYVIEVNGDEAASSRTVIPTLDPGGHITEEIELVANYGDLSSGVVDMLQGGELTLTFSGTITSEDVSAEVSDTYSF